MITYKSSGRYVGGVGCAARRRDQFFMSSHIGADCSLNDQDMPDSGVDQVGQLAVLLTAPYQSRWHRVQRLHYQNTYVEIAIRISRSLNDQHDIRIVEAVRRNRATVVRARGGGECNGGEGAALEGVEGDIRLHNHVRQLSCPAFSGLL